MQDNMFTNDELRVIGKFFTILMRASAKEFSKAMPEQPQEEVKAAEQVPQNRLIPLSKWNAYHDWPTQGGLRNMVFFSSTNGFEKVIKRVGRRVLIYEKAFFEWVESNPKTKLTDLNCRRRL